MHTEYDLIAIGGGAAGLAAAGLAAHLGARALLVESERLGGDCTWTGCIPSKTLLHAASVASSIRNSDRIGISAGDVKIDFGRVMDHVRSIRRDVYEKADRPEIYERMGIDVRHGRAHFIDAHALEITSETEARAKRVWGRIIVVCTGAAPSVPAIPGLQATPHITNEDLFEIKNRPDHLLILGAGPIGIEMSQAFRRLGSRVTVLDKAPEILSKDDQRLAAILRSRLEHEGVDFVLKAGIESAQTWEHGVRMHVAGRAPVDGDLLLVAAGRNPNIYDLDLEAAGVHHDESGIRVDDRCRTNIRHIYAAGDVTGRYQFTHMSEHMAKVAVTNAILRVPARLDSKHVPWVTFTDPELAHVGHGESELASRGRKYESYRFPYERIDRADCEGATIGEIVVYASPLRGRILGASVLGTRAGELISELSLAMRSGIPLRRISDTIHAYPTYGLGVRRAADQWYVQRRSPAFVEVLKKVFRYRGRTIETAPGEIL